MVVEARSGRGVPFPAPEWRGAHRRGEDGGLTRLRRRGVMQGTRAGGEEDDARQGRRSWTPVTAQEARRGARRRGAARGHGREAMVAGARGEGRKSISGARGRARTRGPPARGAGESGAGTPPWCVACVVTARGRRRGRVGDRAGGFGLGLGGIGGGGWALALGRRGRMGGPGCWAPSLSLSL